MNGLRSAMRLPSSIASGYRIQDPGLMSWLDPGAGSPEGSIGKRSRAVGCAVVSLEAPLASSGRLPTANCAFDA